ncbi:tripartite tricarboxylate transporter TctB family protein [Stappia sp. F7233]|uniref:Tripartite tricarboxylate transporter TctB family protein n=1 Tax=Stappia albiluteola TaxID=2758565 RepID=A0A839A9B1_9HYPH|nr:tripartite tricarboxylate transporter TctB family protein [Stappia albiluteola]MBA5775537.1 tripartite tricarboxylate transporter TctB family protein [Stappia albiluteola]
MSAIGLAAAGILAAAMAWRLGLWTVDRPGPGLFPFAAGSLLFATSLAAALQGGVAEAEDEPVDRGRLLRYAAAIAGFGLAMKTLGAVVATVGLILGVLRGIENRSWACALGVAIVLAMLSWGVFRHFLSVPLPAGILGIG